MIRKRINLIIVIAAVLLITLFIPHGPQTAYADDSTITRLDLKLDLNKIGLNKKLKNSQLPAKASGALSPGKKSEGVEVAGFEEVYSQNWEDGHEEHNLQDLSGNVEPFLIYYAEYKLSPKAGYCWTDEVKNNTYYFTRAEALTSIRVFVNDGLCMEAYLSCASDSTLYIKVPIPYDISYDTAVISKNRFTYNGHSRLPKVKSVTFGTGMDVDPDNYTVTYTDKNGREVTPVKAGKYFVQVSTEQVYIYGPTYYGAIKKPFTIDKAANSLKIKAKTATVKYSKLKKKTQKLAVSKVIRFTNKGQGKKTYKKKSGSKKIAIAGKTGKVTVKKGLKKGTYKIRVKVRAAGNANYKASSWKTVTFKVKVR